MTDEQKLLHLLAQHGQLGNGKARELLGWDETRFTAVREKLRNGGWVVQGRGRGGSIRLVRSSSQEADGREAKRPLSHQAPEPMAKRGPGRPPKDRSSVASKPEGLQANEPRTSEPKASSSGRAAERPMSQQATSLQASKPVDQPPTAPPANPTKAKAPEPATPAQDEQAFLRELDKKLWTAADKLRSNLDAAVYKHAVLGLVFLKYVSDSFELRQQEVEKMLKDPKSDFYIDPAGYAGKGGSGGKGGGAYEEAIRAELEVRDYYTQQNVFWVPALARWKTIQDSAKLPAGTEIEVRNGKVEKYKLSSLGKLIDDALEAIERENPKLKNVLNKTYTQLQLDPANLGSLIDLIATIPFVHGSLHAKDILGHVYEYFLGQFALAEGKKGGQYYTPKSIVSLIVRMLQPFKGRVYDPAMGSGGFFVQSEEFIEQFGGRLGDISVYGQESNPTTPGRARGRLWRLAAMNMAIRGIDFNFGKEPANSFTNDQHPALRADYVMAPTRLWSNHNRSGR